VLVTPANDPAFSDGNISDVFAVTIRKIYTDMFVVNVYRVDSSGDGWDQSLRLDWFAAE